MVLLHSSIFIFLAILSSYSIAANIFHSEIRRVADPVNSCWNIEGQAHGIINYKDNKARCRYLKKFTCKGALWQVFYLSEAPFPPMTPCSPSPLHTVYVYTIYLFTQGRGGGRELTREKVRGATIYKLVEIPTSYKHLTQSLFTDHFLK
jgi:hypothetical protein